MRNMFDRYLLTRIADLEGKTLCFMIYLGSRDRGWKTFQPEQVPPFEGKEAVFEIDRAKGGWRFVRQVLEPR
jgi:hypothetical protein